jgi:hypothetical protein
MAITIITKNSDVAGLAPSAGQLVKGELAVNVTDKALYTLDAANNVVLLSSGSSFTTPVVVTVNSASTAVTVTQNGAGGGMRITNTGAGNSLLVEDSANPDATPFLIDANGNVVVAYTATINTQNYVGTSVNSKIQLQGTGQDTSSIAVFNWGSATGSPANLILNKSVGGVIGTRGALATGGADIGSVTFNGDDGTNFIPAAAILAETDGTPGTNNMPGRLVFSTTADGAATPTERMRIDNLGRVAFNTTALTGYQVRIAGTYASTDVNPIWLGINGTIPSTATGQAYGFFSGTATQAAAFTLTGLNHFFASQGGVGAGSTLTNQYGFRANANLTGATNNYGFYSDIPAGTGDWNFYANGTADNFFGGDVIVSVNTTDSALRITQTGTGNALLVEDAANPDSTPFAVDATGNTNIGTTGVAAKLYVSGNAAQNIATLTDAATIAVDMGTANNFSVTLGGNRTLGNPTNLLPGQSGIIYITQDGTGSRTLAYSSFWDFSNGTAPTLTTTAGAVDALIYSVRTSTAIVSALINNVG